LSTSVSYYEQNLSKMQTLFSYNNNNKHYVSDTV